MPTETKPCICIFSALYSPAVGGVETYTGNLARAIADLGYRVILVTSNTHDAAPRENDGTIEIVRLPCRPLLGGRYPVPRADRSFKELWSWLEQQQIDYIIVNTRFYPLSNRGLRFSRERGIAPILIEHGSAHLTMGNPLIDKGVAFVEHALTSIGKRYRASYWAVSAKSSAWLKHFGIASQGELSNSIDADAYCAQASKRSYKDELGLSASDFVVAFVGRLVPEKGVKELAQASRLLEDRTDISFIVAGDGPLSEAASQQASSRMHLLGRLDPPDIAALLAQSDILCLPSRSEGFATSLLEAAACCTTAVATDVGGGRELMPDEAYGTIIPNAEPQTIADAIRRAADHPGKTADKGRLLGKLVRTDYSWEKTARRAISACERAQREAAGEATE